MPYVMHHPAQGRRTATHFTQAPPSLMPKQRRVELTFKPPALIRWRHPMSVLLNAATNGAGGNTETIRFQTVYAEDHRWP